MRVRRWMRIVGLIGCVGSLTCGCYESAYQKTDVGAIEVKTIPAATLLVTKSEQQYFERPGRMFMRLFRYIENNQVSMTVPVEAEMKPGAMKFYVGTKDAKKPLKDVDKVRVVTARKRTVVSIGGMGQYTQANIGKAEKKLLSWLQAHPEHRRAGDPYAVFWDSPFTPGPLRRFEVHAEIEGAQ